MKVTIIGTGYVGINTGVVLAYLGNQVTCLDVNEEKIALFRQGKSPVYEPHLEETLQLVRGNIRFTSTPYLNRGKLVMRGMDVSMNWSAAMADMGIEGQFEVVEMRHFTGPEVPWIIAPRPDIVQWWYVKARLADDPAFAARWLVVWRRPQAQGISAAAPFATTGYRSPDWRAFLGEGEPRPVPGLPGLWVGMEFDFLVGEDGAKPGLPEEVVGCLDGT